MPVYSLKLCEKHDFQRAQQWYEHEPDGVIEIKGYKILWDFTIECDNNIEQYLLGTARILRLVLGC